MLSHQSILLIGFTITYIWDIASNDTKIVSVNVLKFRTLVADPDQTAAS